jgi:2-oxoglutarate/2-oxoacid ferredoxin oxidoreductase subunit alpha
MTHTPEPRRKECGADDCTCNGCVGAQEPRRRSTRTIDSVIIRFAGDSGDGVQLTGSQFTETSAASGNDLATFPDYPAEIRAPTGTLAGVSGYQIQLSSREVLTPGDEPDVLVAFNPAALKANLAELRPGGILIINTGELDAKSLAKAGYAKNPLDEGGLAGYRVVAVDITAATLRAVAESGVGHKAAERAKNFYALGLVYWLYNRPLEHTERWLQTTLAAKDPLVAEANRRALRAGFAFGETSELFDVSYVIPPATIEPGRYRNLSGNEALAMGLAAAAELAGLELFLGTYPITPATDILHVLSGQKGLGVKTFQAEDEIAAVCSCVGAAYAGDLAVTTTSGPGLDLKSEGLGLAVALELPLIVVDVQRAGPSTGMPTKTEQSDLRLALYGRHGEAPLPVLAARSSSDCFYAAIEAARIAIEHMTPVILLSDGYLANGTEPFRIPDLALLPRIPVKARAEREGFRPYQRDEDGARPWAVPGVAGLEHRVGGLEKEDGTGRVTTDGPNHERMVRLRAAKIDRIADGYAPLTIEGHPEGDLLVVGWGGTYGVLRAAVERLVARGEKVGHVHLRHLHPLPRDLGPIFARYRRVVAPELNAGQLVDVLRAATLCDVRSITKLQGRLFKETELVSALERHLPARQENLA